MLKCIHWIELVSQVSDVAHGPLFYHLMVFSIVRKKRKITTCVPLIYLSIKEMTTQDCIFLIKRSTEFVSFIIIDYSNMENIDAGIKYGESYAFIHFYDKAFKSENYMKRTCIRNSKQRNLFYTKMSHSKDRQAT